LGVGKIKDYAIITIKVNEEIKKRLDAMKIHPREPYWEVIKRLLDYMDMQPLTSFDKEKGQF
jgi:hypothetical protein